MTLGRIRWTSLRDKDILAASESVLLNLDGKLKWTKRSERLMQYYLYGYFQAMGLPMSIEHKTADNKSIDFRYNGDNKALLELEKIQNRRYDYEGSAYNNRSELAKLMRHTRGQAQRRILLILDLRNANAADPRKLAEKYRKRWQKIIRRVGKKWAAKFSAVTILYAHHKGSQFSVYLGRNGKVSVKIIKKDVGKSLL